MELKVGDMVRWKFRYGETQGIIAKIYKQDFIFLGKNRKASPENPQYEVISEKTGKNAVHKATALKKL